MDHVRAQVSCDPEVRQRTLTAEDEFLILASDGVWEFLSNEKVGQIGSQ